MPDMMNIILDTSVMIDIFVISRPRHSDAQNLAQYLQANDIRVRLPMFAMFEIGSALKNEKMQSGNFKMGGLFTWQTPMKIQTVPIDDQFFNKYFDADLPYMKAGDLVFVAMAKVDNATLITEDDLQYKKAGEAGVLVYRIREFLDLFANGGNK